MVEYRMSILSILEGKSLEEVLRFEVEALSIYYAMKLYRIELVKAMVDRDMIHPTSDLILLAIQLGSIELFEILSKDIDLEKIVEEKTLLQHVEFYNHRDLFASLLPRCNVDVQDDEGRTALMLAPNLEYVKLLLEAGCEVNLVDRLGRNALFYHNDPRVIPLLKQAGINMEQEDDRGRTALVEAYSRGKYRYVMELVRNGARNNIVSLSK
jgi:ankyrin repeat protein